MPKQIDLKNPKINNLVNSIEVGEVKIPPLQRPFVWEINQIIELLESIYNDYPIGSILWWETNVKLPSERDIAGFQLPKKPESHPFYYVLDGQQRLSSLYGVFCKNRVTSASEDEYKVDPNIFEIFFDIKEKTFVHLVDKNPANKYFELKSLFDPSKYADELIKVDKNERTVIQDLYDRFTNYEVPIVVTKKRDFEEVGVIFERVNNTGTKLDIFDLMVALTWTPKFHLQNHFKEICEILDKKNFGEIKNKVLLQAISAIITESCRAKVITSLKGDDVRNKITVLKESLKKVIDYLSTQLNIGSDEILPHAHQIVPLCYFFSKTNSLKATHVKAINKWFWKTSFSDRYSSGTDKHVDEDIQLFKELIKNNSLNCFDKLKHTVTIEQLKQTKLLRSNPLSRAFLVLLARRIPLDFVNGTKVDVGEALSSFNKKEYHHIFPYSFLVSKGEEKDKINSLCNFSLLAAASNKIISDNPPSTYFSKTIPRKKYKDILESNLVPLKQSIYIKNNYDDFLGERAKKIMEYIEEQFI